MVDGGAAARQEEFQAAKATGRGHYVALLVSSSCKWCGVCKVQETPATKGSKRDGPGREGLARKKKARKIVCLLPSF